MGKWLRRIRGAIGMGLTWAFGWALAGIALAAINSLPGHPLHWLFEILDAPAPAFALPGFLAGAFFSAVLGIAARRRRFEDLSLPGFAAWGALGGVLPTLFPAALVALGLATPKDSGVAFWLTLGTVSVPFVL